MTTWWGGQYRAETDNDMENLWRESEGIHNDDPNDFFGQFIDLNASGAFMSPSEAFDSIQDMPKFQDPFLADRPSGSHGSSTSDELDFLSTSSQIDPLSSNPPDFDPHCLVIIKSESQDVPSQHMGYLGRASMSEGDLPRLEGMTLVSPTKGSLASWPQSLTPRKAAGNKTNRLVEAVGAVSATIRKAANRRKTKKKTAAVQPEDRPQSPSPPDEPIKAPRQRSRRQKDRTSSLPASTNPGNFVHGTCEDPFNDAPPMPSLAPVHFYQNKGISLPLMTPSSNGEFQNCTPDGLLGSHPEQWNSTPMIGSNDPNLFMLTQGSEFIDQKNAQLNMAMHSQQAQLPYTYAPGFHDTGSSGLMIQMPPASPSGIIDPHNHLNMGPHTRLPLPPPIPSSEQQRRPRPPRAASSGARHLSMSPIRKQHGPSASPTRTRTPSSSSQAQQGGSSTRPNSRQNSAGSVSSMRSVSGRLPGSMPGTPCSVRKRRSREPSGSGEIGFVNYTPSDGTVLMTGVAPSGSSKTKARREKEAMERRKKLNEAAIKAVVEAGGDVECLKGIKF